MAFAASWDTHYAPRKAINLGYSGQQTQHILWNLMNGELDFAKSPKVAVLPDGKIITDLMPDLVHPNAAGAKAAAVALEPLLSKLMGDKPILK